MTCEVTALGVTVDDDKGSTIERRLYESCNELSDLEIQWSLLASFIIDVDGQRPLHLTTDMWDAITSHLLR